MRRLLALAAAVTMLATVAAPAVGAADRAPRRVEEVPYLTPALGAHLGAAYGWYYDCELQLGCSIVPVEKGDRWVRLEVVDQAGADVYGAVYTMPGGEHYLDFCTSTDRWIPVRPGMELLVHILPGFCPDGATPSTPTTGKVRATFKTRN